MCAILKFTQAISDYTWPGIKHLQIIEYLKQKHDIKIVIDSDAFVFLFQIKLWKM